MRTMAALWALVLSAALAACGGGGGTAEPASCGTMLHPEACGGTGVATGFATLKLTLVDSSGSAISQVSPEKVGTLQAVVRDVSGAVVPNVAVTFTTTDTTGGFVPASGTALTDATGTAKVGLPAGRQTGGFTASATASVSGSGVASSTGYAVAFQALTLSALRIAPATLSAGGNASVSVTVMSGASAYTPPQPVAFTSPCVQAGKASIGSPVLTQAGIATASYSDKGCGVADTITATVALGDATVKQSGTIAVLPATAGSIGFVSADTTNIALKGTGGFGRQEFSTLTFKVSDTTGSRVAGTLVDFAFSDANTNTAQTVGGLTLQPPFATSAADGTVTTLVSGGTIPTSVRVVATIRGSTPAITTLSNVLVVSTGVPDQRHMSLATETGNCEGRDFDQTCSILTATLGDHFGNPVPDGTAVNFSTKAGVIDASCVTGSLLSPTPQGTTDEPTPIGQTTNSKVGPGSGTCSVVLRASSPRPASGRVTVLAYAAGEESFVDSNGNNVFDAGDTFTDKSPDIFRDDDENGAWTVGEPCIGPGKSNCSTPGDGQYNGVLRLPQVASAQTSYVSRQLVQIFSGSNAVINFSPAASTCPAGGTTDVRVTVNDVAGNLMPAGTTIDFSVIFATAAGVKPDQVKVNNVVLAVGEPMVVPTYTVTVACPLFQSTGKLFATVTTPRGVKTIASMPFN